MVEISLGLLFTCLNSLRYAVLILTHQDEDLRQSFHDFSDVILARYCVSLFLSWNNVGLPLTKFQKKEKIEKKMFLQPKDLYTQRS
jgi:hypothetical protein